MLNAKFPSHAHRLKKLQQRNRALHRFMKVSSTQPSSILFNAFVDMFSSGHKKKKVLDTFQYSDVNDEKIGFPFSP